MKRIAGNHIKLTDGRTPILRSSKLLRAMLSALVVDIANKLEHAATDQHEYLILEWRVVGVAKGEQPPVELPVELPVEQ
jgi:hypothetical protein